MYRIINTETGETVGITEEPRFIRRNDRGNLVQTTEEEAQGVAFRSTPYNLHNKEGVGAEETVLLNPYDAGEGLDEARQAIADLNATVDELVVDELMKEG